MQSKGPLTAFLVTVFILSSCTQSGTVTPQPTSAFIQNAVLYAGPGNAEFDAVAYLKTGTAVTPLAAYGDFIQVVATVDGQASSGYIWKEALDSLPAGLSVLAVDQVPWALLYQPQCSPGLYDSAQDAVTFSNTGNGYYDTESGAIPLATPLMIKMAGTQVTGADSAAIKVLGIPAVSGDWWQGIARMDIGYNQGSYFIGIRDGTKESEALFIDVPLAASQGIQILFDQPEGLSFHILDGAGNEIQSVNLAASPGVNLPHGLFPNGVAYIGTTVPPQASFTVKGLRIGEVPSGTWSEALDNYYSQPGLAELAARGGITIGTEFMSNRTSDSRYCRIMNRNFNMAVLSEFSSPGFWLAPGEYDFIALDRAVDYASRHGWRIRASHLLWGEYAVIPDWLKDSRFTREEYIRIMEQYIRDIAGRYKGRVQEWSVANEASNRSFSDGADFWNDRIGPEYIALAFRTAREADPNGVLIFNDDNNHAPQDEVTTRIIDKMYATVRQLKADGAPIDVIGMQMHFFLPWNSPIPPEKNAVIATMQKFAALGVRIMITELDVDLVQVSGSQTKKLAVETGMYRDMMEACIESGVCDSFSTWGISDSISWITCSYEDCVEKNLTAAPLMFDADFNPKPAYFAVRDALLTDFTIVPMVTPTK
jgi:endo-1,4-beta-xylanase